MKLLIFKSDTWIKKLGEWFQEHQAAAHNFRAAKRFREMDNAEPRTRTIMEKGSDIR